MSRYLNMHVLYSFAGANPNRDDTGTPKSLIYGGVERSRMSPQSMTRAKRHGYEAAQDGERSYRSALLPERISGMVIDQLTVNGENVSDPDRNKILKAAAKAVYGLVMEEKKATKKAETRAAPAASGSQSGAEEKGETTEEAGDTLVWLAEPEMAAAAAKLANKFKSGTTDDFTATDFLTPGRTGSLSIAAFGRMFAQRPDLQNEAALQRANAFTTHSAVIGIDYFTAVDDLRTSDNGAGHIGLRQDTGGTYYWHANIDRDQLLATWNTELLETGQEQENLCALVEHLLEDLPTGAQTHGAQHGEPVYILVVDADSPTSLQTAFEQPVTSNSGMIAPSIAALNKEHERTLRFRPSRFHTTLTSGTHNDEGLPLDDLAARIADWVVTGELR